MKKIIVLCMILLSLIPVASLQSMSLQRPGCERKIIKDLMIPNSSPDILIDAIAENDFALVQLLLQHNTNPNQDNLHVPLFFAQNKKMAKLLVSHGADYKIENICGTNLLGSIFINPYTFNADLIPYFISLGISPYEEDISQHDAIDNLVLSFSSKLGNDITIPESFNYIQAFIDAGIPTERIAQSFEKMKNNDPQNKMIKNYHEHFTRKFQN